MSASRLVDRLRRPEYTGENRCLPCTAVNLLVAATAAVGIALVVDGPSSVAVGGAVLLACVVAIALRGYLVPGTPWLTRTYLPDRVLRRFDKAPSTAGRADGGIDVERTLVGAGALTDCEDGDDLCLAPGFESAWWDRIEDVRRDDTSRTDLADVLGVPVEQLSFAEHGDALVAHHYARPVGQWESRAAFLADVTAARALAGRVDGWDRLDVTERGQVLAGLRLFLERCPTCDGDVSLEEDEVTSCCRSYDVVAATCEGCGARVFEAELSPAA